MENLNWTTFTSRINIEADTTAIRQAWKTQEEIEKWFLEKAEFTNPSGIKKDRSEEIAPGDKYIWIWHGSDFIGEGEILEHTGEDFLRFTFLGCIVSLSISVENGENIIQLTQSDIPLDETSRMNYYVGCSQGWTFYLANLKSLLEGGIDLRNRNKELNNVINT